MVDQAAEFPLTAMVWLERPERIDRGGIPMKRFLGVILMCAMLLLTVSMAEQSAQMLVSCVYSIYGGMENEDCTYTVRLDDSPEMALLTLAKRDGFEAYTLPRRALDDLAELMAAYNPADWSSLPEREAFALDAPERRIELVYADGSEYTLCNDRETGGPIFADAESILMGCLSEEDGVELAPERTIAKIYIFRMIEGGVATYMITMDEGIYHVSIDEGSEQPISTDVVDELMNVIDTYDVAAWDGFEEEDYSVEDGENFRLEIRFTDGTGILASGDNAFPDNYSDAMAAMWHLLESGC